jgi:hypothetical protein
MNKYIKLSIIAFVLSQFSARELRDLIADLDLNNASIESQGAYFEKSGRFKDCINVQVGNIAITIKQSDFLKLIAEAEKEEETINHLPAEKR